MRPLMRPTTKPAPRPTATAAHQGYPASNTRPLATAVRPMIEPTERSIPPVAITAVMPSAMMPMKEKLRVMLKKFWDEANDAGCSQLITRQMTISATVTQNDCAPAIRFQTLCCWTPSTDSIETLACGGGLAASVDIGNASGRVNGAGDE